MWILLITLFLSILHNLESISTTVIFRTFFAKSFVIAPVPGPISNTSALVFRFIDSTIFLHIFSSIRKFCPHFFLGIILFVLSYGIDLRHFLSFGKLLLLVICFLFQLSSLQLI